MSAQSLPSDDTQSSRAQEVRELYQRLLESWNRREGEEFAAHFTEDGTSIGFDGSQLIGREEIASSLQDIFAHHLTPPYIAKVRSVRLLSPDVAILQAVVGMTPPGASAIEPSLNAIQTLVAIRMADAWRIAQFQTTPAQFHGRPEMVRVLTQELQDIADTTGTRGVSVE